MNKIKLRAIEPEDLEAVYEIENDRDIWDVGATNVPYSRFAISQYIINTQNDIYADRQLRMMAENQHGQIVGIVDLTDYAPRHNRAEVGIVIIKKWRKQGFAYAALNAIKEYARHTIHLHKLYAIIAQDNEAAIRLFKKAGFIEETTLQDWLYNGKTYMNAIMFVYNEDS